MEHKQRDKKLRLLVSKLNKERKNQAKKVDILCNDLIAAQRSFIKTLDTISFAANFYQSIVGITDLNGLLCAADRLIKDQIPDANIAFFLRRQENFQLHLFESTKPIALDRQHLEHCFTPELVDNICRSNKVCTLDSLLAMGLQSNPISLNKISAVTVPLSQSASSLGFILIYRSSEDKLTTEQTNNVSSVTGGLSRAIQSCQAS